MENWKTIKEIADDIGVEKSKVKYQVSKLPSYMVERTKSPIKISPDGERHLRVIFGASDMYVWKNSESEEIIKLKQEIKSLKFGLELKEKSADEKIKLMEQIIDRQREDYEKLQKLLDQEQQLHAMSQKKVIEDSAKYALLEENTKRLEQVEEENEILNKENQRIHEKAVNVLSEMSWRKGGEYSKAAKVIAEKQSTEQLLNILASDAEKQIEQLKEELEKEKSKTWWDKLRGK